MNKRKNAISADRTFYRCFTDVTLRYSDTDKLGHVNNAVFATLFESGRVDVISEGDISKTCEAAVFVLASISIEFKAELHFPGVAQIGSAIVSFGSASLTFHQALFKDSVCCATAESIVVLIDEKTRRPKRIPAALRQHLEHLTNLLPT